MAAPAAVEWAKSQLEAGFSKGELRAAMAEFGYSAEEAEEVLAAVAGPAQAMRRPEHRQAMKPEPAKPQPQPPQPTPAERLAVKDEPPSQVHYEVEFNERASRLELFIRFFYLIPVAIVLSILTFLVSIVLPLEWAHTLLLGRRNKTFNDVVYRYSAYFIRADSYAWLLTDERPPIIKGVGKLLIVAIALYAVLIGAMLAAAWFVLLPMLSTMQLPAGLPL